MQRFEAAMRARWRWILVVTAATAVDLLARFGLPFSFARVMHVEAVLFPLTAVVLARLLRREPDTTGWTQALRIGLVWFFALGGLRPVLWTLGLPLMAANIATVATAALGVVAWMIQRRHRLRNGASAASTHSPQPTSPTREK
jgi:hypothetical protein